MSYFLRVYDNFHYMDDDEVDDIGSFSSEQEALKEEQRIVKNGVIRLWSTGTKIDEIVSSWLSFGTDPTIRCTDQNIIAPFFSAIKYAEAVAEELTNSIQDDRETVQSIYQETILFAAEKHAREKQYIPGTSITPYAVHLSKYAWRLCWLTKRRTVSI